MGLDWFRDHGIYGRLRGRLVVRQRYHQVLHARVHARLRVHAHRSGMLLETRGKIFDESTVGYFYRR